MGACVLNRESAEASGEKFLAIDDTGVPVGHDGFTDYYPVSEGDHRCIDSVQGICDTKKSWARRVGSH